MSKLLFEGSEWSMDLIDNLWEVIDKIATEKYGLTYYEPQIEIVTADQMLYHHSLDAMPILYSHWSNGRRYIEQAKSYKKGMSSIAYETIINTDPMITYIMEDNSATMQAIVLAHAVCGHGSFFKNNYLFKQGTDASGIVDYLLFAKRYISKCEELYGAENVEKILDACHAMKYYSIDKYKRRRHQRASVMEQKYRDWLKYEQEVTDAFWDDMFKPDRTYNDSTEFFDWPFPEENILYFIEKNAPHMPEWKREIIRIVRKISQYFYPQMQTKVMNEGWASFWHYTLMTDLYDQGYINEGSYMEFLVSHSGVTHQPRLSDNSSPGLPAINPYALGFAMFKDIKRACENPTEEDYKYMPMAAGKPWLPTMMEIMQNFKDENFIREFLSPRVIKDMQLFCLEDDAERENYEFVCIQDEEDYRTLRKHLADQYSFTKNLPQIEVVGFEKTGDRTLNLRHTVADGKMLDTDMEKATNKYLGKLWGYPVELRKVREDGTLITFSKRTYQ